MFYRDFMQKYRPVYAAPDGPAAGAGDGAAAAAAVDSGQAAAAAPAAGDVGAAPAADGAAAAPAAGAEAPAPAADGAAAAAPAAGGEAPKSEPSLLEAADGKPKPDAVAPADGEKKDPAPAEAAKPDDDAKPDGDKKPEGEPAKDAKPDAAKDPKDAAKADPEKKDATAEAQPPVPIKYEAFKLPEGTKLDDERLGKFTEIAGAGQVTQEVAQQFVDLHLEEMARYAGEVQKQAEAHQRDVWNKLNDTWKGDLRKDEKLGGNRIETTLSLAKAVIEEYGGTPEQVQELIAHTSNNGMGNFPGFIRLLANLGEALNVFEEGSVGGDTRPTKPSRTRGETWYPSMNGGGQPQT